MTQVITEHLASAEGGEQMRTMMARHASSEEIMEAFAAECDEETAASMHAEFSELPRNFVYTFMMAWGLAVSGGLPFTLASAAPDRPVEYAHRGRVSYEVVHEDRGVTMYVSHVHGRHADWFKQPTLAV